ncbi:hypothetical protein V5799_033635 [Amblyomma americanum]|uniref:MAM domain-containing protein n=1 Tax=Amblyomma americanum TaxID=6943 RepID=A0AAQ4DMR6_AMBAM
MLRKTHGNCSDSEFRCRNGACVGKERRCNFVDDCGDNSDEKQCGDRRLRCNFDSSFCDWVPETLPNVSSSWSVMLPTNSLLSSPTRDHTTGTPAGKFAIFKSGLGTRNATLLGPTLAPSQHCAVSFYYTLQGWSDPLLTLNVRTTAHGPWKAVWEQSGPTESFHFMGATVDFTEVVPYQVAFIGEHRKHRNKGYIAVDDVAFSVACKKHKEALAVMPTPKAEPAVCDEKEFYCADNDQCISVNEVCDFKKDCRNGADESRCGACDFATDMCGLQNEYRNARFGWKWTGALDDQQKDFFVKSNGSGVAAGYAAYALLNPGAPPSTTKSMVTPPLGEIGHLCVVTFYAYIPNVPSSKLVFGVLRRSTGDSRPENMVPLAVVGASGDKPSWVKIAVKTGMWSRGVRFFYQANAEGVSIDQPEYHNCYPRTRNKDHVKRLRVDCDFSEPLECGWFPEGGLAHMSWILQVGGVGQSMWKPAERLPGGGYMFAKNIFLSEKTARLVSIEMDKTPGEGQCFSFW